MVIPHVNAQDGSLPRATGYRECLAPTVRSSGAAIAHGVHPRGVVEGAGLQVMMTAIATRADLVPCANRNLGWSADPRGSLAGRGPPAGHSQVKQRALCYVWGVGQSAECRPSPACRPGPA